MVVYVVCFAVADGNGRNTLPKKREVAPTPSVININTSAPASSPENETPELAKEEKPQNWFFTELADKPPHEWGRVWSLELHRVKPDVPGVPGTKGYLRLFSEPVTLETIRATFGGGRFRLNLLKHSRYNTSHEFEIEGQPIYDPKREQPTANGNGISAGGNVDGNVLKVLEQQNERLYQVLTTLQGAKEENPAVSSAVDILTSAYKTGLSAVATQPGGSSGDATKQLETVLSLAEKIVSIGGSRGGGLTEAITLLTTLGVITKPKTLAEQIADAQALKELIGGGDAPPKDWKAAAVQAAVTHLPEILDTFKTTSANAAVANQARARAAEVVRGLPPSAAAPATAPANTATAAPANAAPPLAVHSNSGLRLVPRDSVDEAPAAPEARAETATASPLTVDEHRHALKINVVNLFMHGASGNSIASYVEDVDPEFAADFGKYTTDQIISFFATDPILNVMVNSTLPPSDPSFPTRLHEVLADAREFVNEGEEVTVN